MKSRSLQVSTKKGFMIFLPWRYGLSWSTTHPLVFPSRNATKNAETYPPPMRDAIIELRKSFFFQRQKRRCQDSYKRPRLSRKTNHSTNGNVLYVWIAVYGIELYLWLRTILIVIKDPPSDTRAHELNPQPRRLRFYEAEAMVWEGENKM